MRGDTICAVSAAGLALLLCAGAAIAAAPTAGRFTLTRTLPDGRTETRSVTLDELRAMTRATPAPMATPTPKTLAPDTVVFALPAPIADPAPAPLALAVAPPQAAKPLGPAAATTAFKAPANQAPSAAAIRVATAAGRASALHAPLTLSGGWALANREDAARDDGAEADADTPMPLRATGTGKSRKGDKTPLGVRDGKSFGQQGRFYLYAGVKNRGVGLNLTDQNGAESGGWDSAGVSYDRGGFAGQRSAGVGWRQGDVSTSLGWVHEKNNIKGMWGAPAEKDDRVALTFSWRPSGRKTVSARAAP